MTLLLQSFAKHYFIIAAEVIENANIVIAIKDGLDEYFLQFLKFYEDIFSVLKTIPTNDEYFKLLISFPSNKLIAISDSFIKVFQTYSPYNIISIIKTEWPSMEANGLPEKEIIITISKYIIAIWNMKTFQLQSMIDVGKLYINNFSQFDKEHIMFYR